MKTFKTVLCAALLAAVSTASARTIEMDVNGLVCAFCAQGIEKTMKAFPATDGVLVSLEHRLVAVHLKDGQDIADAALRKAITDAGYKLVAVRRTEEPLSTIKERIGKGTPAKAAGAHEHGKDGHMHDDGHAHGG
jgi:mercuric ion binding protein